ncbi:pro-sigmaK processing inhibitor BofA family protein [Paenibacillus sacheonensis]|uniref:Pro-sigmaK processing inhibitor BofA n=1 Tax=Paenibacillus sacheonensis TaxID=742054 RepID=A0A7X4YRK9_9BACL|nr:pro-sigmaK processing inhibitor BofA family protein [Paenibacillus sacheonensis]MBM7567669.1 inhibitor of the pro-sigma K processing machinery [Paenibacillus sacheonensis]NBC71228.1 pro-sigmaK processing inhibitor BofA [Paenibacillus sacheonensis]
MKSVWMIILLASSLLLLTVVIRNRLSFRWIRRFALHLVAAALALYVLNYSGVISGFEVPLNPATIGTVVLLGLPGIALVLGLQVALF